MSFNEYRNWLREHDPLGAQEFDYLDTIDIKSIIQSNKDEDVDRIMCIIEDMYEDDYLAKYTKQRFRAIYVWLRLPVMVCRCCIMREVQRAL